MLEDGEEGCSRNNRTEALGPWPSDGRLKVCFQSLEGLVIAQGRAGPDGAWAPLLETPLVG